MQFSLEPAKALAITTDDGTKKVYPGLHHIVFSRGIGQDVVIDVTV